MGGGCELRCTALPACRPSAPGIPRSLRSRPFRWAKGAKGARSHRGVHINRYPQSPSWERAGLAVCFVGGRFETCPYVRLSAAGRRGDDASLSGGGCELRCTALPACRPSAPGIPRSLRSRPFRWAKGAKRARSHRGVHLNRYPQSPSWERAGLAVVWLVGAGLRPASAWVCVRGRLVGGAGSGPGIPCVLVSVSWAPRPLTLKRRGRWGGREGSPLRFWLVTGRGFCASGWTFSLLERRQDDGSTCRMN